MNHGSGARRTALLLHTLPQQDRDSLLARFDVRDEKVLRGLLKELAELGIPTDKALLDDTIAGLSGVAPSAHISPQEKPESRCAVNADAAVAVLRQAPAQYMAALLAGEPPELIARVLACHAWPWSAALLESQPALQRRQTQALLHATPRPADRLSAALLELLAARLRDQTADADASGGAASPEASWKSRWMAWRRKVNFPGAMRKSS